MNNKKSFFAAKVILCFHKKYLRVLFCAVLCIGCLPLFVSAQNDILPEINKKEIGRLLKKAKKHFRKGELKEAEIIFRRVLQSKPDDAETKVKLSYLLLKQNRLMEAYKFASEVTDSDPQNSFAYAVLGGTFLSAGRFKDAKLALYTSLNLNKREALAWAELGMLDFYENRTLESLKSLQTAVYFDPREPDFIFSLAKVSSRAERYKESAEAYRTFLRISNDTDKERRDRIQGLIKFLWYLGNRTSLYRLDGDDHTTVPISLVGNRPVIQIRLKKNEEPLNFVLDTGSGMTVISKEASEKFNLKQITEGGLARAIGGDGTFPIVYGFINSIYIGDVEIENIPIFIRDFQNHNKDIDGYIGISLISHFLMTVDYGNLTFTLDRKESSKEKLAEKESLFLPLRLTSSGFLSGEVLVEGVKNPLNFVLDTGASISVISADLADTDEIKDYVDGGKMRVIGAAGVAENVPSFLLPRVSFGDHSRESLKAVALDLDLINEASGFEQSGILGGNFLKNYKLTFDFENSKVIFVPNK